MADSARIDRVRYFGDYLILGEIARGGMGVVYLARQSSLNRDVALKLIKAGTLASRREIELFRWEAEAAAGLSHPHIVRVYEFGEHEGQPFVAMEFIEGCSLAAQLKEGLWTIQPDNVSSKARQIAQLTVALSDALHHAHQHGVIHRDLKPGNILLNETGEAFVTDFGLAKLLHQDAALTQTGQVLGTPSYMTPEQAAGRSKDVTAAADVYGLGAILYALLTNQPPFQGATDQETLDWVRLREPISPSTINPFVPADLATISLKCLEKEPVRRYASALHLQEDLERWLRGEAILARPSSAWERTEKWIRRHPQTAAFLTTIAVCVMAGAGGILWQWRRANAGWTQATTSNTRLRLQRAEDFFERGDPMLALATLARALRDSSEHRATEERLMNALHSRRFLVPTPYQPSARESNDFGFNVDFQTAVRIARRGGVGAFATNGETIQVIRDGNRSTNLCLSPPRPGAIRMIALSSDTNQLASAVDGVGVCLWDLRTGALTHVLEHPANVEGLDFSPDAQLLATGANDGIVRVWWTASGSLKGVARMAGGIRAVRFHESGSWLASGSVNGVVQLWRFEKLSSELLPASEPRSVGGAVDDLHFRAEANLLFVRIEGTRTSAFAWTELLPRGHHATNWPAPTLEPISAVLGRAAGSFHGVGGITATNLSPDGARLATASTDRTARLWNAHFGTPMSEPLVHGGVVNSVSFSPDGHRLLTSSSDRRLRVWDVATTMPLTDWLESSAPVIGGAFLDDGARVVSSSGETWAIHRSKGRPPDGLADLAEAIAGVRIGGDGVSERIPHPEASEACRVLLEGARASKRPEWLPPINVPAGARLSP